jgi:hypothetical protein
MAGDREGGGKGLARWGPRSGKRKHLKNFVFGPRTLVRTWGTPTESLRPKETVPEEEDPDRAVET